MGSGKLTLFLQLFCLLYKVQLSTVPTNCGEQIQMASRKVMSSYVPTVRI